MSDWQERAEIDEDVVFFQYADSEKEKQANDVYVWDLDKTYLDTKFETFKGLVRTIFEKAFQKKNIPGTAALVRGLQENCRLTGTSTDLPLYFITASPPQMEKKILEKLELDHARPYGVFCKDNLQNLRPRRMWRLTQQVGYKAQALLQMRLRLKGEVRQILWGDDSESDAVIYSLYSDICARRMSKPELEAVLTNFRVVGTQMKKIFELQEQLPIHDPVEKIYINLEEDTDPEYYQKFGRRTVPTTSTFQTAVDLFQDGRLQIDQVLSVAEDLMTNFEFTTDELERGLNSLVRREVIGAPCIELILPELKSSGMIHPKFELQVQPKAVEEQVDQRVYKLEGSTEPWIPERIDYLHDYR